MSEINVTPLVDVMLVLLIIFMVTAPMMQQGIEIDLPETAASGIETSDEPFVLSIRNDNKLYVAKEEVQLTGLRNKLKAIFESRKNKQVYLKADRKVDYELVAQALAEIRAAGIYNIGLVTLPK
jgi:biopolymer transport protein TolR